MPNQRKKSKKLLNIWLEPEELQALKEEAKKQGKTMTDLLKERIHEKIKKKS